MTTIENRRFALITVGAAILFLLYQAWEKDYPPPSATPAATATPAAPAADDVPVGRAPEATAPAAPGQAAPPATAASLPAKEQRIHVRTDVLDVELTTLGGDLRRAVLLGYAVTKKNPDEDVALLDDRGDHWFVIQSGLTGSAGAIVSHKDLYAATADRYVMTDGVDRVDVPLTFTDPQGRSVTKTYTFRRGSYAIELNQRLTNTAGAPVMVNPYVQLWRTQFTVGEEPKFVQSWMGMGLYEQKGGDSYRFRKLKFEELAETPIEVKQSGGWVAMLQHYFVAAVIPPAGEGATYVGKPSSTRGYLGQYIGAAHEVPARGAQDFAATLYVGPKLQQTLGDVAPGFELTVDYGWLTAIAKILFWILNELHKLVGNWGWAIILLTLTVRAAMYKLSEAQYRSMAKMKKYAPRIQEIKDRYGDDRERMNKAMMELYKKEKFNPLAGCWPLLIQFPVFIALYWVLLESVELRQADFALWLNDLSSPDPYYVMPVLFGISMYVQQKLSGNVAMDPMQQRVMNMMPVMLTVFFAFFPAGLVLYWFVSNLIGIAQQWWITRKLTKEGLRH